MRGIAMERKEAMSTESVRPMGGTHPDDAKVQRERIEHLRFNAARCEADIAALQEKTVRGYRGGIRGGVHTVSYAEGRATALQKKIDHEVADGDQKHDRVRRGMKLLVLLPLLTDFLIVLLFLASIFNVS